MAKAYIGTVTFRGLESFLSESDSGGFAIGAGAADGRFPQRVHYWAAVSDDVAAQIRDYLRAGDRHQALLTLEALATDIAPLERVGRQHHPGA